MLWREIRGPIGLWKLWALVSDSREMSWYDGGVRAIEAGRIAVLDCLQPWGGPGLANALDHLLSWAVSLERHSVSVQTRAASSDTLTRK